MLGRGNLRTLFYEIGPSFLMSYRRFQEVASLWGLWPVVKKPGGLCLSSLQLDLSRQHLRRQPQLQKISGLGVDTEPLSFPCPHPDTQSLCLSSTVSSPCGLQARFCQLKPCQEGLVGVLPAAGASPQRPQPPKPPQIQSWHAHKSLHCAEGGSAERQLSGSHSLTSSPDACVRLRARDLC